MSFFFFSSQCFVSPKLLEGSERRRLSYWDELTVLNEKKKKKRKRLPSTLPLYRGDREEKTGIGKSSGNNKRKRGVKKEVSEDKGRPGLTLFFFSVKGLVFFLLEASFNLPPPSSSTSSPLRKAKPPSLAHSAEASASAHSSSF